VCVVAFALLEASAASGPRRSSLTAADVLAGSALPWDTSSAPAVVSVDEAFGLDDDMRAFVAPLAIGDSASRLSRLLGGMRDRGLFSLAYNDTFTRTASATFHDRQGNCLSFTMLFVALAREAGLLVRYQVVDVPPKWNNDHGLVVVGTHVNALVGTSFDRRFVVDFNAAKFREIYPTRAVSDRYAVALFYNNLGAEALARGDFASSFALLREAARTHPDMTGPWVNLGVLYARNALYEHAEAAYQRAIDVDSHEQSALANLANVYSSLGEKELADEYRQRVRRYRESNPYYHYALAQVAYGDGRFEDALTALRTAIRLKHDDDEFYSLRGRALVALGRADSAVASFARAKELAVAVAGDVDAAAR
jgi:tetratricopeptide (TPR) repeat protein